MTTAPPGREELARPAEPTPQSLQSLRRLPDIRITADFQL